MGTCFKYFGREGRDLSSLFPGAVMYGVDPVGYPWGEGTLARDPNEQWSDKTGLRLARANYERYSGLVPSGVVDLLPGNVAAGAILGVPDFQGYKWVRVSGGNANLNEDLNLGSSKVVLLVEGDFNVRGKITLNDGSGFFMVITGGDINVYSNVTASGSPALEGIFAAEGRFVTGRDSSSDDSQFWLRGVVSAANVTLSRDLDRALDTEENNHKPAELFEYAPDIVLRYPRQLSTERVLWREVQN